MDDYFTAMNKALKQINSPTRIGGRQESFQMWCSLRFMVDYFHARGSNQTPQEIYDYLIADPMTTYCGDQMFRTNAYW